MWFEGTVESNSALILSSGVHSLPSSLLDIRQTGSGCRHHASPLIRMLTLRYPAGVASSASRRGRRRILFMPGASLVVVWPRILEYRAATSLDGRWPMLSPEA
eukprot:2728162-Prymnesium_polylepis.1